MKTAPDHLIDSYMNELAKELRGFPGDRRREIIDEVREHVIQARAELERENEAAIRTILDRLGEPADIAASARERFDIRPVRAGVLEGVAVVALVVPFIGWLVGTILIWLSHVWTTRDKVIATIAVPGTWLVFFSTLLPAEVTTSVTVSSGSGRPRTFPTPVEPSGVEAFLNAFLGWFLPLGIFVVPIVIAIYLVVRARNLTEAADRLAKRA